MNIKDILNKCLTSDGRLSPKRLNLLSSEEISLIEKETLELSKYFPEVTLTQRLKFIRFPTKQLFCRCGKNLQFSNDRDKVFKATCGNMKCSKTTEVVTRAKETFSRTIKERKERILPKFSLVEQRKFIQSKLDSGLKLRIITSSQSDIARFISSEAKVYGIKVSQYCYDLLYLDGDFNNKICSECNKNMLSFISFENGYTERCSECGKKLASKNKKFNVIEKVSSEIEKKGEFEIIESRGINENPWKFSCKACNTIFEKWLKNGRSEDDIRCPKCQPHTKSSLEYDLIEKIKEVYDGEVVHGYRLKDSMKSVDIFIPQKRLGIEINGIYWHSDDKYKHKNKLDMCASENITLLQFTDLDVNSKSDIVFSMIKNKLGLSKRIFSRKTMIREITSKEYRDFTDNNHIKGYCAASIKLGAFYNEELVSVISLSSSRFDRDESFEIIRFCSQLNTSIVGGFSKFLNYVFSQYSHINKISSFVDLHHGNGDSYRRVGFESKGVTEPNYFYWFKDANKLYSRMMFQKHKLKEKFQEIYSDEKTEEEIMKEAGYRRYYDCGNEKFIITRKPHK
jgi:hypothetical protein